MSILLFDSGVGGLSIFFELQKKIQNFSCHYLLDNKFFPYGSLQQKTIISRLTSLIINFQKKQKVDLIIIACNTASTVVLPKLRALTDIPIIGVVPALKPATKISKNKNIALLATNGTIKRKYTKDLIDKFTKGYKVKLIANSSLVEMAENKFAQKKIDLKILDKVLLPLFDDKIDTLILGCTHFPLLKIEINSCLNNKIQLVDSGEAVANQALKLYKKKDKNQSLNLYLTSTLTKNTVLAFYKLGFKNWDLMLGI